MKLLRNILGLLSLAVGLALLGECAAHTARSLLAQGVRGDLSFFLLKGAFFAPNKHSVAYQILLGSGALLTLIGVVLTRTWALPFFLLSALCFAVLGGRAVERTVVPKGDQASLVQDGVAGLGGLFAGDYGDPAMVLGLGLFGLMTGLYLTHGLKAAPAPAPMRPARPARATAPAATPSDPDAETPFHAPDPSAGLDRFPGDDPGEAHADTSVDLDLSPDVATSELEGPAPAVPPPSPDAVAPGPDPVDEPDEPDETEPLPPPPPAPPGRALAFTLPALLLGLGSVAVPVAVALPEPLIPAEVLGTALPAGAGAGLAALGLALLARPRGALGIAALSLGALGVAGGAALVGLGA